VQQSVQQKKLSVLVIIFHVKLSKWCGPVMDWRPVQGVPCLSPDDRWDRLQPPRDLTDGLSGYRKWMDGSKWLKSLFTVFCEFQPSIWSQGD